MLKPPQKLLDKGRWWERAWSLVDGCTPVSPGCEHCWSASIAHRFNPKLTDGDGAFDGGVYFREDRLDEPLRRKKPTVWAVWNDLFHEAVTDEQIVGAFGHMDAAARHVFFVLTKRPERMAHFTQHVYGMHPRNVWLGVTVENQDATILRLPWMPYLARYNRFLSVEPLIGPVTLDLTHVDWVIVGGESGPKARRCEEEWIASVADQCFAAEVPCFVKQMGTVWSKEQIEANIGSVVDTSKWFGSKGQNADAWPEELRVREWPDDRQ